MHTHAVKQGSHIHDFQQDFNKTKTHAVKCEEQVAVFGQKSLNPVRDYTENATRYQLDYLDFNKNAKIN